MKKSIQGFILILASLSPFSAHAGGNMLGTSPLLLALSVTNVYYQRQVGDKTGLILSYSSVSNLDLSALVPGSNPISATFYGASYKGYADSYAHGLYIQLGATYFKGTQSGPGSVSGIAPIAVVGMEGNLGTSLVLDAEVGLGTGNGWGVLGLNAAYAF